MSTFLPVEWGGQIYAYCKEKGQITESIVIHFIHQVPPCDTLLFSADFVFSNITKDGTEESVARLGLTCVQDWDETGAQEKMAS